MAKAKHELWAAKPSRKPEAELRAAPSSYDVTHPVGSAERFLDQAAKEALAAAAAGGIPKVRQLVPGAVKAMVKAADKYPDPLISEAARLPAEELARRAARAEAFRRTMQANDAILREVSQALSPGETLAKIQLAAGVDSAVQGLARQDAKGGRTVRAAEGAVGTKETRWNWDTYEWNPENTKTGKRIDPKNIKGTGIAFDAAKNRLKVPAGREKEFEAYMDNLANPPETWKLEDGREVPVKSYLVPKDWRTNKEYDKDYDYVAAFLGGMEPGPVYHGPKEGWVLHGNDIGKMPTHPTFSGESYYAKDPKYAPLAGRWEAETYHPGPAERAVRQDAKGGDAGSGTAVSETPVSEAPAQPSGPRIVINPTTFRNSKDALCVAFNEGFRLWMEATGFEPKSEPTESQRKFFSDTAYADDELQLRRTILARIATFDTSVKDPTDDQLAETASFLNAILESDWCKNEWERNSVGKLAKAVAAAVGAEPVEPRMEPVEPRAAAPLEARAALGGGQTEEEKPVQTPAAAENPESGSEDLMTQVTNEAVAGLQAGLQDQQQPPEAAAQQPQEAAAPQQQQEEEAPAKRNPMGLSSGIWTGGAEGKGRELTAREAEAMRERIESGATVSNRQLAMFGLSRADNGQIVNGNGELFSGFGDRASLLQRQAADAGLDRKRDDSKRRA